MHIVVIGHGMVGHKFVETLAQEARPDVRVTVLGEEPRPAYDRVHLSEFFSRKSADELSLVEPGFFEREDVVLRLNAKVVSVDCDARSVTLASGERVGYDKLVLATGSYPFVPPVPGADRKDCFVYRTIEDLEAMQECGARSRTGVVVGGGLLGLECAKALRDMGLAAHVVEFAPRLMAVQVDDPGAQGRAGDRLARRCRDRQPLPEHRPARLRDRRMRAVERPAVRPGGAGLRHGAHLRAPHPRP